VLSLILATGASLAWGSADFIAGVSCRRLGLLWVLLVSQQLGLVLLLAVLLLIGKATPGWNYVGLAALAGAFNAAALAAFYRGLARGPIGLVAPIAATEAIIPVAAGLLNGERPSHVATLGIALALGGVMLATTSGGREGAADRGRSSSPSVALAVLAAVCFGCFVVALKGASEGGALWAVTISRVTTIGLLAAAVPATSMTVPLARSDIGPVLAIGALDVAASTVFAVATTSGALSAVGVLGSLYPVVTLLLAGMLLRERLGGLQRLGTLGALAGVALITAS
jgi:drug/metabolite transporter (DMT)-like permease